MRGCFITLEGGEGVGKSTQLSGLKQMLEADGHEVITTREPGGTPLGERLRELLKGGDGGGMHADTELLLMFAARNEHLQQVIRPALDRGIWVICDRFTDATYAYQGGGRGLDRKRIEVLESWVQSGLQPDLTLLFDAPVETGFERVTSRGETRDRFELEARAFYERIRQAYLARAAECPERIRIIDATGPVESVTNSVQRIITDFCNTHRNLTS